MTANESGSTNIARLTVLIVSMLLLLPWNTQAEEKDVLDRLDRLDRFKLWNDCQPMKLVVEDLPRGAADIGLTKDAITTAVRSRLRSARLYDADKLKYLYVQVSVVGEAFSVDVEYRKLLLDSASGEIFPAMTWDTGSTGTHGRDSGYVLSTLSGRIDKFIDEYLRVNAEACER